MAFVRGPGKDRIMGKSTKSISGGVEEKRFEAYGVMTERAKVLTNNWCETSKRSIYHALSFSQSTKDVM